MELPTREGPLIREAAARLGVDERQIFHLIVYRQLRPFRGANGRLRVTEQSFEEYRDRQRTA